MDVRDVLVCIGVLVVMFVTINRSNEVLMKEKDVVGPNNYFVRLSRLKIDVPAVGYQLIFICTV